MHERAGAPESPKNSEYTSLNTEKSSIFARKQVVLSTVSSEAPDCSKTAITGVTLKGYKDPCWLPPLH